MDFWKIGLLGTGAGAAAAYGWRRFFSKSAPVEDGTESSAEGRLLIAELGRRSKMTPEQIKFLTFVARGESRFNTLAGAGDPDMRPPGLTYYDDRMSEANGARIAYERNSWRFEDCGHADDEYTFGSGGFFAFLPTIALYQLRKTPLLCASPYEIFDPAFAMTAAYGFARALKTNRSHDGTIANLRAGWGNVRRMSNPTSYADRIPYWQGQLKSIGFSTSYLTESSPDFPERDLMDMYRSMGGSYGLA